MTHQNPSLGMCWKLFWATLSSFDNGLSNRYLFKILILQGRFQFCICLFQDGTPNLHAILLSSFFPSDSFSLHCKFLFSLLSCRFCASSSSACSLCTVSCFWASSFSFRSFSIHSIMGMCRISQAFSNCHSLSDLICGTNILHTQAALEVRDAKPCRIWSTKKLESQILPVTSNKIVLASGYKWCEIVLPWTTACLQYHSVQKQHNWTIGIT